MVRAWFQRIRNVPILDVISSLGYQITNNGKNKIRSHCILPNHNGDNKTGTAFCIDKYKNVWYCHSDRIGGGNIELVKEIKGISSIEAANVIARFVGMDTFDEIKASTPEEKAVFKKKLEEQTLVYEILTIAAHHFHSNLTEELRNTLLIPQGTFEPKDKWKNPYQTWGITDEAIDDNIIGYDDGTTLVSLLKDKGYSDKDILKSGLFSRNDDGSIGDSVFKHRLTFPYLNMGEVTNFIARSTDRIWPCYKKNPSEELKSSSFPYTKYKKLPLYDPKARPYISECINTPLFGIEELRRHKNAVMVEGITDVILMRMFFGKMREAGINEASHWGVASFLSNQITNEHIEQLIQAGKNKDTLLFLCDNETSGRGSQGAANTAKKLLEGGVLTLIGEIPLEEGQEKMDPAQWVRDQKINVESNPQAVWESFKKIVQQAQNIIEITLNQAKKRLIDIKGQSSCSYFNTIKSGCTENIVDLISLLPEIKQEDYLVYLTEAPFNHKLTTLKKLKEKPCNNGTVLPEESFSISGNIPEGWAIKSTGLYKAIMTRTQEVQFIKIAEAPMVITEKYYDVDTEQYYLKAGFYEKGDWKYHTESREVFMTSRFLPNLAKWGFPTSSENAKELVKFLTEYEAANRDTIKISQVVSSCGNKRINGENAFILGRRCIYKDREESIEFFAPDIGDQQIIDAFEAQGDLEVWKSKIKKCASSQGVMLSVYTSFSGPFLKILKGKGFTDHLWGRSSIGKSITTMICASAWGDPEKLVQSWNQKEVAAERRMAICNEVGIFLDDLKQAISKEMVEHILYAVTNGHGRGRGSLKGQQKTLFWLLPLISNGEMPATQTSTDEGGQARVINIRDHLFGSGNVELVRELELTAKKNYGLAGPYFIQHANVAMMAERAKYYLAEIGKCAKSDIAYRIGSNLAVILAVGDEVNRVFGLTEENAWSVVGDLVKELLQDASTIDRATAALNMVSEWISANEGLFYPHVDFKKDIAGLLKEDEFIGFFPYKLKDILEKFGYNYEAVLRDWEERNWLKMDKGHKSCKCMINGKRIRLICLKWEILQIEE